MSTGGVVVRNEVLTVHVGVLRVGLLAVGCWGCDAGCFVGYGVIECVNAGSGSKGGGGVEVFMMVVLVVVCWECDYWRRMLKVGLLRV